MNRKNFVDVDVYQRETSVEQAAADCGVVIEVTGSGKNVRIDCPFGCDGDHAGKREIAIDAANAAKQWKCHAYGCACRGNLLNLMYGWISGTKWSGEKLRGEEFNVVKKVIAGEEPAATPLPQAPPPARVKEKKPQAAKQNPPLLQGEKSKMLMEPPIWEKLSVDIAAMSMEASAYVRRHPSLSSEAMQKWCVGYMPKDGGGDKRGWSLRNHIIYPFKSEAGDVIAFVGRDPAYEDKCRAFEAEPPEERDAAKRPIKHRFPKGFKRGIELFGQQRSRLEEPSYREAITRYGIIVVEGFNDVIRLDSDSIPAVAICSNIISDDQIRKLVRWSRVLSQAKVSLMFDCDEQGDNGAADAAWRLLQAGVTVQAAWGRAMSGGDFAGRQPESVTSEELSGILEQLTKS